MGKLKKSEKILIVAAGVMIILLVFNHFVCSKEKAPEKEVLSHEEPPTPPSAGPEKSETKPVAAKKGRLPEKPPTEYQTWGRDPFYETYRLVNLASDDSSNFRLNGIIKKGNEAYVLIGDAILRKGQRQGDLTILDIKKDRVVCRKGRRVLTLVLRNE